MLMEDLDLSWMSPGVRQAFDEGVRLYAEAVRDGTVMHMQDGSDAMQRAAQLHIRLQETGDALDAPEAVDPSI
jgi:hypothetical protein